MKSPELTKLETEVNTLNNQLGDKENELFAMRIKAITVFLIKTESYNIDIRNIDIGSWKCEGSPIGICFYDYIKDPALDNCLICGQPHERK